MEIWINCAGLPPAVLTDKPVLLGRSRECDFRLPHSTVSRKHAWIGWNDAGHMVVENRSSQELLLNGDPVREQTVITVGDELIIGPYHVLLTKKPIPVADPEEEATAELSIQDVHAAVKQRLEESAAERTRLEEEIKRGRRELESEVWRGMHTNRELTAAQRELEKLKEQLAALKEADDKPTDAVTRPKQPRPNKPQVHLKRPQPKRPQPKRPKRPQPKRRPPPK